MKVRHTKTLASAMLLALSPRDGFGMDTRELLPVWEFREIYPGDTESGAETTE